MSERRLDPMGAQALLAQERTLLGWWRSGLAALAMSLAVARLLPAFVHGSRAPFLVLGVGFAVLGFALIVYGTFRDRIVVRSIEAGRFRPIGRWAVVAFAGFLGVLAVVTIVIAAAGGSS
jgi:uncharacterized membrane protein YidH (DUF202 family)